jgi:hypothetical protein
MTVMGFENATLVKFDYLRQFDLEEPISFDNGAETQNSNDLVQPEGEEDLKEILPSDENLELDKE